MENGVETNEIRLLLFLLSSKSIRWWENGATFQKDSKGTVGRMAGARQNLSSKFAWLKVLAGPKGISSALRAARYRESITASIRWWNTVICTVSIAADESAFTNYIRTCSSISIYSLAMLACNSLVRVGRTARGIIVHEDPSYLRSFCHLCFIFSASNLAGRVTFFGRWTFIGETSFSATLSIYSGNC